MPVKFTNPSINYYVDDVEAAVQFYCEHFGFTETFRTPMEGKPDHVEVTLGSFVLGFASREAGRIMHGLPLESGGPPRAELVVWVEDVDAVYADLIEKGVPGLSEPHDFIGLNRAAWVSDPDGNPVEIVSRQKH